MDTCKLCNYDSPETILEITGADDRMHNICADCAYQVYQYMMVRFEWVAE
jgi:hypothetical protein